MLFETFHTEKFAPNGFFSFPNGQCVPANEWKVEILQLLSTSVLNKNVPLPSSLKAERLINYGKCLL